MPEQAQQSAPMVLCLSDSWVAAFGGSDAGDPSVRSIKAIVTSLAEMMPDAFWIRTSDRRALYVNGAFERISGVCREDVYRRFDSVLDRIHPDDRPAINAIIARGGRDLVFPDTRLVRPDGTICWVRIKTTTRLDESGRPTVTLGTAEDITEYHETLQRLTAGEAQYRLLVEAQDHFIVKTDTQGCLLYVSPSCCNYVGKTEQELLGKPYFPYVHPDDLPLTLKTLEEMNDPPHVCHFEHRVMTHLGWRWIAWRNHALTDARGAVTGAVCVGRDVTDRRRAREELARAIEQAEHANREKDHFLAMLSHELRTPLTPVLAAISSMEHDERLPEATRQELLMVHRNIDLESRLIDDLLDLTRISRGKLRLEPRLVDAEELLSRAITISAPDIDAKHIRVTRSPGASQTRIIADPARIQQVLWNIIKNAVQYTDEGGRIEIQTSNQPGCFVVRIIDNGIGIDPAFLPRIFEAFEQELRPKQHGGLGLGLAISRTVVDLHGGSITAESEGRNQGSRFTVTLPLADVTEPSAPARPAAPLPEIRPGLRVLLVEDHPSTLDVLSRVLKRMGHDVMTSMTVAEAKRLGSEHEFDLLISDIGLPDGSGLELMAALRSRPALRAIALSGYGMDQDITNSREAGFHAHLTKPVDVQILSETIRDVLAQ